MSTTEDYDVLIRPYEAQMIQSIGRIIPDPDRAEEVLQESVLKIWDRRERIKVHPNPKAYVLSTCITVALDELRRLKRHQDAKRVMLAEGRHRRAQSDPSDAVMAKEVEEAVMASISKLSSQQATAVLLRLVYELPYDEVAVALDCAETTARTHVARGREVLERSLAPLARQMLLENK